MSLSEALSGLPRKRIKQGRPCGAAVLLAQLPPDERESLERALDSHIATSLIGATLRSHGHQISNQTLRRHRRRQDGEGCACPP